MLIVCPSCATSYDVEPARLQPNGRQVRCVRCGTVWHAELSQAAKLAAAAAALSPERATPEAAMAAAAAADDLAAEAADAGAAAGWLGVPPAAQPGEAAANDWQVDATLNPSEAAEAEAPPIVPDDLASGGSPIDAEYHAAASSAGPEDIETFAARHLRRAKRRRQSWSLSRLQTMILVLLVADAILVGWRSDIVRVLPQTASLYGAMGLAVNLRGLSFVDVVTRTEVSEGVPILVVQGNIVNDAGAETGVPRLKFVVRNAAKNEIYSWTTAPPRPGLSPHEAVGFRTRLASPPPESHDVLVRFLNHRDVVVEAR
jgi:predicted Zn finger-like uncharacterized protein